MSTKILRLKAALNLPENFITDGRTGFDLSGSIAIGTGITQVTAQVLTVTLARHFDQTHFADLQDFCAGLVGAQAILQCLVQFRDPRQQHRVVQRSREQCGDQFTLPRRSTHEPVDKYFA